MNPMRIILSPLVIVLYASCSDVAYIRGLFEVDPEAAIAQIHAQRHLCQTKAFSNLIPLIVKHADMNH